MEITARASRLAVFLENTIPYPFKDNQCAKWYAKYPRKKAPGDVERAWAKLDPDAQAQALKTVEGFAQFWMRRLLDGDNICYCPFPASYLNAGRHWDEPDPVAPPPPPSDFR